MHLSCSGPKAPVALYELCIVGFLADSSVHASVCIRAALHAGTIKHRFDVLYTWFGRNRRVCVCVYVCVGGGGVSSLPLLCFVGWHEHGTPVDILRLLGPGVQNCCRGGASDLLRSTGPAGQPAGLHAAPSCRAALISPYSRKTSRTALLSLRSFLSTAFLALFLFAVTSCVCDTTICLPC